MGTYTSAGLVEHAKKALTLKNVYMNSMILREITPAYYEQVMAMLKTYNTQAGLDRLGYTLERQEYLKKNIVGKGYYGVDCVCLIKSYYWGGVGSPFYTASNDVNANVMYQRAKVKGKIGTMPDTPGIILYSATHPHVGIYIGGGETIESTLGSRGDGIVKRKLDSFWEYWFECPYIDYPKAAEAVRDESAGSFKVGDTVRVKEGAKTYTGARLASFVYKNTYTVMEIGKSNTNRIVIGIGGKITAAVRAEDLIKQ